jgi:hypothetical protein
MFSHVCSLKVMREVAEGEAGAMSPVREEELVFVGEEELGVTVLVACGTELCEFLVKVGSCWGSSRGGSSVATYL